MFYRRARNRRRRDATVLLGDCIFERDAVACAYTGGPVGERGEDGIREVGF